MGGAQALECTPYGVFLGGRVHKRRRPWQVIAETYFSLLLWILINR